MFSKKELEMSRAIVSNLPIEQLEATRSKFNIQAKLQGKRLRIRFFSPDIKYRVYCSKKDAVSFSVYFD